MYGYSNRAAIIIFGSVTCLLAASGNAFGLSFPAPRLRDGAGLSYRLLGFATIVTSALATAVWATERPGLSFQEAPYFLDRYAMFSMGQHLYRDIDFPYGPLMFYLPVGLARVSNLNLIDAFFVAWIFQWIAGVAVLWKLIDLLARTIAIPDSRMMFLFFWAISIMDVFASGPNYTLLRYASGPLVACVAWRLATAHRSVFPAALFASLGTVLLLLYSPEQGIALGLSSIIFGGLAFRRSRNFIAAGSIFCLIVGASLAVLIHLGELSGVRNISSGALNVPVFLGLQNLAFLGALLVAACGVWNAIRTRRFSNPLVYISLISAASIPAAFGNANPSHLFYNLFGALLGALAILSNSGRALSTPVWRLGKVVFAILFVGATVVEHAFMDHSAITVPVHRWIVASGNHDSPIRHLYIALLKRSVGPDEMARRLAHMSRDAADGGVVAAQRYGLAPGAMVLAPFGVDRPAHEELDGLRIYTGRYPWLLPLLNAHEVSDKIAELKAHPTHPLLIPDVTDGSQCRYNLQVLRQTTWQNFLPLYIPAIRHPITAADPLCAYINANYVRADPTFQVENWGIWLPKDHTLHPHAAPSEGSPPPAASRSSRLAP